MRQKHSRITSTQNRGRSSDSSQIGNIFISEKYEKDQVGLILDNRGENVEFIHIYYSEPGSPTKKEWKNVRLPRHEPQEVRLPKGFEKWEKLYFQVAGKERSVSNASLRKLLDEARRQGKIEPSQSGVEPSTSKPERSSDSSLEVVKANAEKLQKTKSKQLKGMRHATVGYQNKAETVVRVAQERVMELARAYRNGEPIDLGHIETPTPSQKVLLFLNSLARDLSEWKTELEESGETHCNLIDTLTYRVQDIRDKLKEMRGESPPVPNLLEVATDINTCDDLNEIRNQCAVYVARFEGRLFGYEERCEVRALAEYDQFILQFIKDRLFNGVARFVQCDQLPEQLDKFLKIVGYEVVPIEVGKTKADSRIHDIQSSRQAKVEPGSIVEVVLPGLRRITDGEIVQKPLVIRGEWWNEAERG